MYSQNMYVFILLYSLSVSLLCALQLDFERSTVIFSHSINTTATKRNQTMNMRKSFYFFWNKLITFTAQNLFCHSIHT